VTDRMDTSPRWETPGLCRTYVHAKQQQHIVRTKAPQSSTPFALVHSDLCGPMKHSIGGAQYYIIYIDDCPRYTEVYFLITKTAEEISAKFQHYQAWVETQGFHIKRFQSDNGSGEYNNSIFLGLLGEKGITFEPSPLYTQHKNGTAEDDPDTECEGTKYDVGCKHADNILAGSHQDGMLPASKVTNIESDGQPVTIQSIV